MITDILTKNIIASSNHAPTIEQLSLISQLSTFALRSGDRALFCLRGYAGTGKTTIVASLVKSLIECGRRVELMAPTGRAAKVLSQYTGVQANTIHKKIYRQKSLVERNIFQLGRNSAKNRLFIVDESSMIANNGAGRSIFGSGRLLDDLIEYVYSGQGCKLILLGDTAQLPPVGETESPALNNDMLANYGLEVHSFVLTQVVRQSRESSILLNATNLRLLIEESIDCGLSLVDKFRFNLKGGGNILQISGSELIERIGECYHRDGIDNTIVLCRSNKRANIYNAGIRNTILDREEVICRGEYVMVVKNNYYWTEQLLKNEMCDDTLPSFIANGDVAEVLRVNRMRELYGFKFADATLLFHDYGDMELDVTIMLDTLHSESPSLNQEESERLYSNVMEDYLDVRSKKRRMELLRENPYFNAVQIKYAYAITCHKAQGGQWKSVFIDWGNLTTDGQDIEYGRWLYTALTRSTEQVYLVNWPKEKIE